jgi:biotin synthase-like enzyme
MKLLVTGAVETANPELHNKICPSKSLDDVVGHAGFSRGFRF